MWVSRWTYGMESREGHFLFGSGGVGKEVGNMWMDWVQSDQIHQGSLDRSF